MYSGGISQQHALGDEVEINSVQFGCLTAFVALIDGEQLIVINDVLLPFNKSNLHIQSARGQKFQQFDIVILKSGVYQGQTACLIEIMDEELQWRNRK